MTLHDNKISMKFVISMLTLVTLSIGLFMIAVKHYVASAQMTTKVDVLCADVETLKLNTNVISDAGAQRKIEVLKELDATKAKFIKELEDMKVQVATLSSKVDTQSVAQKHRDDRMMKAIDRNLNFMIDAKGHTHRDP